MSNIDKRALREAADSVIQKYGAEWFESGRQLCTVHKSKIEFIAAANPDTVLALLDELEAKDKRIAGQKEVIANQDKWIRDVEATMISATDRAEAAEKRIAELEARTVTLPKELNSYGGVKIYRPSDVIEALRAAGIKIKGE